MYRQQTHLIHYFTPHKTHATQNSGHSPPTGLNVNKRFVCTPLTNHVISKEIRRKGKVALFAPFAARIDAKLSHIRKIYVKLYALSQSVIFEFDGEGL
jgi:hypothetical protein